MDIREAIRHCREVVNLETSHGACSECAKDHKQLADWLTQLKQIAEIFNCDLDNTAQLKELCDKLRDWHQAEQDGRLVVLPCKVGDTLYAYYNYPTTGICKAVVTDVEVLNGRTVIHTDAFGVLRESDVGENVFLTRQEAEAALERRKKEVAE